MNKTFFDAIEEITAQRNLEFDRVIAKVCRAMEVACRNASLPYKGSIKAVTDVSKKNVRFYNTYTVVREINEEKPVLGEISLKDAKTLKQTAKIGDVIKTRIDLKLFNRKAASQFRSTFLSELIVLEKEETLDYFKSLVGKLITGRVSDVREDFIEFAIGKNTITRVWNDYLVPNVKYLIGSEKKMLVKAVEPAKKFVKVTVSLLDKDIVTKLFEEHVPEIKSGDIVIKGIERFPGVRTKVGVQSLNPEIDAKGACVGPGGMRVKAMNEELDGEIIDVFLWNDNPELLMKEALGPSEVLSVEVQGDRKVRVIVPDDQFSLAIGAKGINVRLAVGATGYSIDIKKLSDKDKLEETNYEEADTNETPGEN